MAAPPSLAGGEAQRVPAAARLPGGTELNYQHVFHAGNFADVAKHVALLACLDALRRKDGAFMVLDTHAGRGIYDLQSAEARKSQEAERGVQALIRCAIGEPCLQSYFTAIGARAGKRLANYPGSPALIAARLRSQDRAVLVEWVSSEARAISREIGSSGRLFVETGDGYAALKAHLPPIERRGLVLIDPPYENIEEAKQLLHSFATAYERWPTGIYLLWYPIRSAVQRRAMHARFETLRIPKMMYADLAVWADDAPVGLAGSGLIIVNPPFGLDLTLTDSYRALHTGLAVNANAGYVDVGRLTPERF